MTTIGMKAVALVSGGFLAMTTVVAQDRGATVRKAAGAPQKSDQTIRPAVNADALALVDFKKRTDAYGVVHRNAAKAVPPMKESADPAAIKTAQQALVTKLRDMRAEAKAGDVFTPEIRAVFRKILVPEMKGEDGRDAKEILKDDAPISVPLKVNASYPEGATRATVPAALLDSLPKLPAELEYRFFERHLVLLDTKAAIIVDFIPNAIR